MSDGTYGYYSAPADFIIQLVSSWIQGSQSVLSILETQATTYFPAQVSTIKAFLAENQSPLAEHFPLMNPFHVLTLIIGYLLMVFIGKEITKNFPRLEVKTFALVHNFGLVLLSGYMCYGILAQAFHDKYKLFGNAADHTLKGLPMAKIVWVFYVSKIWEFVDTMIMIVKKNYRQVSFLHVYHHCTIFGIWWYVTLLAPNGEAYFSAAFNSLIHVIMYGYYFCTAIGIKQVSFIKRYITTCQMFQFFCMFIQASYDILDGYVLRPNSPNVYPTKLSVLLWFYMISMLGLFYNFFVQDQKRAKLAKKASKLE